LPQNLALGFTQSQGSLFSHMPQGGECGLLQRTKFLLVDKMEELINNDEMCKLTKAD
jgi:hypothetical protein